MEHWKHIAIGFCDEGHFSPQYLAEVCCNLYFKILLNAKIVQGSDCKMFSYDVATLKIFYCKFLYLINLSYSYTCTLYNNVPLES